MKPPHLTSPSRGTYYDSWGTPNSLLQHARDTLGIAQFGYDLASSEEANKLVQARHFWTKDDPFVPSVEGMKKLAQAAVWCNPPGPVVKVRAFWDIVRRLPKASFLFFSMDHMKLARTPVNDALVCMLSRRVQYVGAKSTSPMPSALVVIGWENARALEYAGNVFRWGGLGVE